MDLDAFYLSEMDAHQETALAARAALHDPFRELVNLCLGAIDTGGKILFFGNGGSAADAQHLATELVARYKKNRPAIAALALSTDTSALTAIGNDFGFEDIFARQVEALARPGDVAIGISTSGNSENVVRALSAANEIGATSVAFTGQGGGRLADLVELLIAVPSADTARIQEMHILIGHMLCGVLEQEAPAL